ncbi:MAG: hypothetical protein ACI976_002662, partial [Aureispira sp.]
KDEKCSGSVTPNLLGELHARFFSRIWGKKIIQMFILFFYCSLALYFVDKST